jgi:hypothetical protein
MNYREHNHKENRTSEIKFTSQSDFGKHILLDVYREFLPSVVTHYAEKTKYMVMSRDQNAGQNGYIQIGNKSFETVEQFKNLGTTLTNQNSIHEEIKSRLKSGNACYHSVQNLLSSSLLSKNVKIKI